MSLPLEILAKYKVEAVGLDELEGALFRFGMRLRLTGRDYLRLGAVMDRFFTGQLKRLGGFLAAGELWQEQMGDLQLAVGDVADVFASILDPVINTLVNLLEEVADWIERNPWAIWLVIIPAIAFWLGKVISAIVSFTGYVTLLAGSLLTARKAGLSFGESLKFFFIRITQGEAAARAYLAQLQAMGGPLQNLGAAVKENIAALKAKQTWLVAESRALKFLESDLLEYSKRGVDVSETLDLVRKKMEKNRQTMLKTDVDLAVLSESYRQLGALQKNEAAEEKTGWKTRESGVKRAAKGFFKFVGIAGILSFLGGVLFTAWEPIQDLFEALGDVFIELLEPLSPLIEGLAEWIEENPELVKWLLVAIVAIGLAVLALDRFGVFGQIAQKITGALSGTLGKVVAPTEAFSTAQLESVAALAALIGAIAALIAAFAQLISVGSSVGMNVWDILTALGALFAEVLAFLVGIAAVTRAFTSLGKSVSLGVAAISTIIGAVAALMAAFSLLLTTGASLGMGITDVIGNFSALLTIILGFVTGIGVASKAFGSFAGETWKGIAALSAVIGVVSAIIAAFTLLISTAASTGMNLGELIGALSALLASIIGFVVGIGAATRVFGSFSKETAVGVAILIGVIGAITAVLAVFVQLVTTSGGDIWSMIAAVDALFASIIGFMIGLAVVTQLFGDMSSSMLVGIGAMLLVIGAIIALVTVFGNLAVTLAQTGAGLPIIWGLVGAIIALVTTFAVLSIVLGAVGPMALLGAVVLLVLAGVLFVLGAALNLVASAAQVLVTTLTAGFAGLAASLGIVIALVPALFMLGAALLFAGIMGMTAMIGLIMASVGLFAVSGGLMFMAGALIMIAGAIYAIAGALKAIPDWARGLVAPIISGLASLVGGILGAIGGIFARITPMQKGGIVLRPGLAYLHAGEVVTPAKAAPVGGKAEIYYYNTFYISGEGKSTREIAEEVARMLAERA